MNKKLQVIDRKGNLVDVWGVDFETYYDTKEGYSLKKMPTAQYIRDPRFKAHGASYYSPTGETGWVTHKDLPKFFVSIDWSKTAFAAQNCVTGDHEILTTEGWVRFDQALGTEQIAQWDPETQEISFTDYKLVVKNYSGNLYCYDSLYHQGRYTEDHRCYYSTPNVSKWRAEPISLVSTFSANSVYFPTSGSYKPKEIKFDFTEQEARLLEAFRADGSWPSPSRAQMRFHFSKQRKVDRLLTLLDDLSLLYTKTERLEPYNGEEKLTTSIYIKNKELSERFFAFLGENKKYTSNVLYTSSLVQQTIIDEAKYWDGSLQTSGSFSLSSAEEDSIQWLQIIAHLNNRHFRYKKIANNRGFNAKNENAVLFIGTLRNKHKLKLQYKPNIEFYEGNVYCVSVPTKAFLVRRNNVVWVTGNCSFDALILNEHYNVVPSYYLDTMSMSRGEWGPGVSASLHAISKRLGRKGKIEGSLEKTDGIRDLSEEQEQALIPYAVNDIVETMEAFKVLYFDRGYPEKELHIIDLTIRAFADPKLEIDAQLCQEEIEAENRRMESLLSSDLIKDAELSSKCKEVLLGDKGLTGLMRSRPCFAELLRSRGIEPPLKERKDKAGNIVEGEYTYAFAKNDIELITLGEDPRVSDLVAVWCGLKSTIRKAKAEKFLAVTNNGTKPFPIPLLYCGGRTHRWSGAGTDDQGKASIGYNIQNMNAGRDGRGKRLREAIKAPKGYVVVACDASQIELRCSAWLAGEQDLLDELAKPDGDPYSGLATEIFGIPVSKSNENKRFRFIGKEGELALQFGVAYKRLLNSVRTKPEWKKFGFEDSQFDEAKAERTVALYRAKRKGVTKLWDDIGKYIALMAASPNEEYSYKLFTFHNNQIIMPNQLGIHYPKLHYQWDKEAQRGNFVYWFKDNWVRIWGSKCYENLIQSLARSIVAEQALTIADRYPVVLLVHDEIVYLAPEPEAEEALEFGLNAMRVAPSWCEGIPLNAEGGFDKCYSK